MNIQYYGDYCFKISTKPAGRATEDVTLWTDVLGKGSGLRAPQGQADIVLLTHGNTAAVKEYLRGEPIVVDAPGEYSVKGVPILGFPSFQDAVLGKERGQNTVFVFESEEIHIAFLGAVGHDLSPEILEKLNGVDILFIPIGGAGALDAKLAVDLARKIEPSLIIPMHYKIAGLTLPLESEKAFCEAIGNCPQETVPKLNIKKKDLETKQLQVVLLERGT